MCVEKRAKMTSINFGIFLCCLVPAAVFGNSIEKFGCSFLNDKYEVEESVLKGTGYGKSVAPLSIKSEAELETLLSKVKAIRGEVLKENIYDDVDSFLDFHEAVVKANATGNLDNFLKTYPTKFYTKPHADTIGLTIILLDSVVSNLKTLYPNIGKHVFMGAVQYDIFTSMEQLKAVDEAYFSTDLGKRITHVVGVLPFTLPNRPGFIVFDSGFSMSKEVLLVMQDGKSPAKVFQNLAIGDVDVDFEFEIQPATKKMIIGKFTMHETSLEKYIMINVAQPYCLARYKPQKFDLLHDNRYMVTRKDDTTISSGFYFFAFPSKKASESKVKNHYKFFAVSGGGEENFSYVKLDGKDFECKDASSFKHLSDSDAKVLKHITSTLKITPEELVSKFKRIQKLMNDESFLVAYTSLEAAIYDNSNELASQLVQTTPVEGKKSK